MMDELDQIRAHLVEFKKQGGPAIEAHSHCSNHRLEIEASAIAGCFYCCETFPTSKIDNWVDDETTAMCPHCGIDSVIGDASGFPVGDKAFLEEMNGLWF